MVQAEKLHVYIDDAMTKDDTSCLFYVAKPNGMEAAFVFLFVLLLFLTHLVIETFYRPYIFPLYIGKNAGSWPVCMIRDLFARVICPCQQFLIENSFSFWLF